MEEYYLMWLSRVDGIGFKRFQRLIKRLGSGINVWNATKEQLLDVYGLNEKVVNSIIKSRNPDTLDEWVEELEEHDIRFYSFFHSQYPTLLKEIFNPPMGIYVKGEIPDDNIERVSIVGARKCSAYGSKSALKIAEDLVEKNIIIVSGMARGIDSMAHQGALQNGGKTIAVVGSGLDICYPKENLKLMEEIINNGCVISEYPPKSKALPGHFPQRNRIISGLSRILVVVEAGKKSGTLITVDLALENGREVFAVPGNITSHLSEGTNNLIKQGCTPITEGADIFHELKISYNDNELSEFKRKIPLKLGQGEREVYECIQDKEPTTIQQIITELDKPIQEIQYILTMLEISGAISKDIQGGYVRES